MELTQIFGELHPLTPTKPARGDIGLLRQKEKVAHDKSHRERALLRLIPSPQDKLPRARESIEGIENRRIN